MLSRYSPSTGKKCLKRNPPRLPSGMLSVSPICGRYSALPSLAFELPTARFAMKRADGTARLLRAVVDRLTTEARLGDDSGVLKVTFFGQPWLAKQVHVGSRIVVSGKVESYMGMRSMASPKWEPFSEDELLDAVQAALKWNTKSSMD